MASMGTYSAFQPCVGPSTTSRMLPRGTNVQARHSAQASFAWDTRAPGDACAFLLRDRNVNGTQTGSLTRWAVSPIDAQSVVWISEGQAQQQGDPLALAAVPVRNS